MSATIAIALIVAGTSLAGVYFGWRLGMTERLQQWRRDKQIEAYSDFIGACADAAFAVDRYQSSDTEAERGEALVEMKDSIIRFHNAFHRLLIVAPPSVRSVVDEITDGVNTVAKEIDKVPRDDEAINRILVKSAGLRVKLSEEARRTLGFGNG